MKDRKFGIEIEANGVARYELREALIAAGIRMLHEGGAVTGWKIVGDGSVRGRNPFELVSPVLSGRDGIEQIQKVCAVLAAKGAKVNSSCGLHVHVDARDMEVLNLRNALKLYVEREEQINLVMPATRRDNSYCVPVLDCIRARLVQNARRDSGFAADFDRYAVDTSMKAVFKAIDTCETRRALQELCGGSRYRRLNMEALDRHGTLEFRQHSGTVTFEKMSAWIDWCVSLVEYSMKWKAVRPSTVTFDVALAHASAPSRRFLTTRRDWFARRPRSLGGA